MIEQSAVAGVMEGCCSYRAKKYFCEALTRLMWHTLLIWVSDNHPDKQHHEGFLKYVSDLQDEMSSDTFQQTHAQPCFTDIAQLFGQYLDHLQVSKGLHSTFWKSYIDMVGSIQLAFIGALYEGNWELHLSAIDSMMHCL